MRQGDPRIWRVRGLPGFDLIFQNIPNNYIQKKMGGVRCQEVTLSHSLRRRSPLQSFFPFSVAICQEECLQYPETWKPASSCYSFLALPFIFMARPLICQITGFIWCFLSNFRVTCGDVLFSFLGESSVPRNRAEGVVLQPELELVTRVLLRFPFQRRKSLCCLLKTLLVKYLISLSKQL